MRAFKFLDTNVLLYAYDLDAPAKRQVALDLLAAGWSDLGSTAISVQVLQEMHVNLMKRGISQSEAAQLVHDFSAWPVMENSLDLLHAALDEQARWDLSFWDSMIIAAARASGASQLITEDLNHGQNYGGVTAINPFLRA